MVGGRKTGTARVTRKMRTIRIIIMRVSSIFTRRGKETDGHKIKRVASNAPNSISHKIKELRGHMLKWTQDKRTVKRETGIKT